MRIIVVSDLPHFVTGGAEMQAMRLIEAWLDAGHEVVCMGRRMGKGPLTIGAHVIDIHRIRTISLVGRWGRALSYFFSLAWLLLRYRAWTDVVYVRFLNEAATTTALLKLARLIRAPLIATPASTHGGDTGQLLSLPLSGLLVRLLNKHCDAINLIAHDMAGVLESKGFDGHNFSHIPNGIKVAALPRPQKSGPRRLVAVGRLVSAKGYDVLLRAAARQKYCPNGVRIRIIGDGPERDRLHALSSELHLEGLVEWMGELSPESVAQQLESADVFVLPSRYEGMSNAGLEAMERGLPLVITRCGGLDKYVSEDMGWVVPVEDEAALAGALDQALAAGPDQLVAMGARARHCVEREFDIKVIGRRYVHLFEQLLERGKAETQGSRE